MFRLYLRGQFCAHRNAPEVNGLWAQCPHLGSGLVRELETKHAIVRKLQQEGKGGRTRFISAEGCYSWVVANAPGLRVKFAYKAFADWSNEPEFYVVDGAARKCARPKEVWSPPPPGLRPAAGACDPLAPRVAPHTAALLGVQRPKGPMLPLATHANCSRWVEERYRVCADLPEETAGEWNVFLKGGPDGEREVHGQRWQNVEPAGGLEAAFVHFQRWKGHYGKLRPGDKAMPKLHGRKIFKMSPHGFAPLDVVYDDVWGGNVSAAAAGFEEVLGVQHGMRHEIDATAQMGAETSAESAACRLSAAFASPVVNAFSSTFGISSSCAAPVTESTTDGGLSCQPSISRSMTFSDLAASS